MLIRPREELLDLWRSVVAYSYQDDKWHWGGRDGTNSISDAEQLLCILYPATNIPAVRLDRPDETSDDVLASLRGLGSDLDVPRVLVQVLTEYMERHRVDGNPTFGGGSYLDPATPGQTPSAPTPEQDQMEIVDAFSMSVTLTLGTLGFARVLRGGVRSQAMLQQISDLERLASQRLTAAMAGLLRSFSVRVFEADAPEGKNLCTMLNQGREADRVVADRFARHLGDLRASLREELSIGSGQVAEQLDNPSRLFECGWSWGVVRDAPEVDYAKGIAIQRPGLAEDRPYLYFTGVALDGIEDLFSERTRILGLLDDTQQRLAQALQLRWDLALQFWNRAALFGTDRWPVEDIPWRTTDGVESDYFSLFVASMVVQRLARERVGSSALIRVGRVLEELAERARITRRPLASDSALSIHWPGVRLRLNGSEEIGPQQAWSVSSFSSLILKRAVRTASLVPETEERDRLTALSDEVWKHLLDRRIQGGPAEGLWDRPSGAIPVLEGPASDEPSWYHTQRIAECMVSAAIAIDTPPRVSQPLAEQALEYLAEAEHLFDQERLNGTPMAGPSIRMSFQSIGARLERARALLMERPGTAVVLAQEVLRDLDELAMARRTSAGFGRE